MGGSMYIQVAPYGHGRALYLYERSDAAIRGAPEYRLATIAPLPPPFPFRAVTTDHGVGFSFGDLVDDIVSPVESAASWLASAGLSAVDAMGSAITVAAGGVVGFSSDVWQGAMSAASFVGDLPGINLAVRTVEDATHIIRVILDSPITAIVVVIVASALNTVGLGSGLMAEYAALRLGFDMMDKLEHGDPLTLGDVAQAVVYAAGSATGLPVGAAYQAAQVGANVASKIANGQPLNAGDAANLILAAASVGAGASGSSGASATVASLAAAKKIADAEGLTGGQVKQKLPANLDQSNVAHLPGSVVRHLGSKIPGVAADAIARSPQGQQAVTAAAQRAQVELLAANKFQTTAHGLYAGCGTDALGQPILTYLPDGTVNPACAAQFALKAPRPVSTLHVVLAPGAGPATSLAAAFHAEAPVPSAQGPGPQASGGLGLLVWSPFMATPNPLPRIGYPTKPPAYHLPITTGPRYNARDIGA